MSKNYFYMSSAAFEFPYGDSNGKYCMEIIQERMAVNKEATLFICGENDNLERAKEKLLAVFGDRVKSQFNGTIRQKSIMWAYEYELSLEELPLIMFCPETEEFMTINGIEEDYPIEPDRIIWAETERDSASEALDYWYDDVLFNYDEAGKEECMDKYDN